MNIEEILKDAKDLQFDSRKCNVGSALAVVALEFLVVPSLLVAFSTDVRIVGLVQSSASAP